MVITILGKGAWGSALGSLVRRNNQPVSFWSRRDPISIGAAIANSTVLVSAVSMSGVSSVIEQLQQAAIAPTVIIVTATKGLDPQTTKTPSQIWQQAFPNNSIVVLSGPNLSPEIEQQLPAATVLASHDLEAAKTVQTILASASFRIYLNQDPLGTELGGTLKNVMAIASGICDGMGLGTNAKAALITRALPEIIRVGVHLGAKKETFFGLSGLGDLIATCDSPLSRNYQLGYRLAQGQNLEEIIANLRGTAEGINTTKVLMTIAQQKNLSVPITQEINRLLNGEVSPQSAIENLMARELQTESYQF